MNDERRKGDTIRARARYRIAVDTQIRRQEMRGDETDDRQPGSQTTPRTPRGARLDRHAGRHEQTYKSRERAGRHPSGRGSRLTGP